jgi:hypothetical protein
MVAVQWPGPFRFDPHSCVRDYKAENIFGIILQRMLCLSTPSRPGETELREYIDSG